jgi:hypothetical protein
MKEVLFKKWIAHQFEVIPNTSSKKTIKGTGCWENDFINKGSFHQWGSQAIEAGETVSNQTIALIEDVKGLIHEILPCNVKFL